MAVRIARRVSRLRAEATSRATVAVALAASRTREATHKPGRRPGGSEDRFPWRPIDPEVAIDVAGPDVNDAMDVVLGRIAPTTAHVLADVYMSIGARDFGEHDGPRSGVAGVLRVRAMDGSVGRDLDLRIVTLRAPLEHVLFWEIEHLAVWNLDDETQPFRSNIVAELQREHFLDSFGVDRHRTARFRRHLWRTRNRHTGASNGGASR